MRRGIRAVLAAGVALAVAGCQTELPEPKVYPKSAAVVRPEKGVRKKPGSDATPQRDAVAATLLADIEAYNKAAEGLTPRSTPTEVGKALKAYAAAQEALPTDDLPPGFKDEFEKFRKATRKYAEAAGRIPDDFEGDKFVDLLKSVFTLDFDRMEEVRKKLGGDLVEAAQGLNRSMIHMHREAMNFGIDADL